MYCFLAELVFLCLVRLLVPSEGTYNTYSFSLFSLHRCVTGSLWLKPGIPSPPLCKDCVNLTYYRDEWALEREPNTQHRTAQIHILHDKIVIHLIAQVTVAQPDIAPAEAVADGSEQLIAQV